MLSEVASYLLCIITVASKWNRDTLWNEGDSTGKVTQNKGFRTKWETFAWAMGIYDESRQSSQSKSMVKLVCLMSEASDCLGNQNVRHDQA